MPESTTKSRIKETDASANDSKPLGDFNFRKWVFFDETMQSLKDKIAEQTGIQVSGAQAIKRAMEHYLSN